jgi:hypothetical protein
LGRRNLRYSVGLGWGFGGGRFCILSASNECPTPVQCTAAIQPYVYGLMSSVLWCLLPSRSASQPLHTSIWHMFLHWLQGSWGFMMFCSVNCTQDIVYFHSLWWGAIGEAATVHWDFEMESRASFHGLSHRY